MQPAWLLCGFPGTLLVGACVADEVARVGRQVVDAPVARLTETQGGLVGWLAGSTAERAQRLGVVDLVLRRRVGVVGVVGSVQPDAHEEWQHRHMHTGETRTGSRCTDPTTPITPTDQGNHVALPVTARNTHSELPDCELCFSMRWPWATRPAMRCRYLPSTTGDGGNPSRVVHATTICCAMPSR